MNRIVMGMGIRNARGKKNKVSTLNKVIKEILNEEVTIKHWQQLADANVNYIEEEPSFQMEQEMQRKAQGRCFLGISFKKPVLTFSWKLM